MIYQGDCLEVMRGLEANSIDALVTDPPAGISFMGKKFDTFESHDHFIQEMKVIFRECLRVMKPGAHGFVWALPRTSHLTATALDLAGFEIRDVVNHIFGSGFPKSHDISKAMNKLKLTLSAEQWEGWGSALKPACEHWILIRKPLEKGFSLAENTLKWGCGGINIDGSRIGTEQRINKGVPSYQGPTGTFSGQGEIPTRSDKMATGRFPSNLLLSHSPGCIEVGTKKVKGQNGGGGLKSPCWTDSTNENKKKDYGAFTGYASEDGTETEAAWECSEGCAVRLLDEQSGTLKSGASKDTYIQKESENIAMSGKNYERRMENRKADSGGASRFFYCAKPSKSEKNLGCEGLEEKTSGYSPNTYESKIANRLNQSNPNVNSHPTVKSTRLMSYLINLITTPNGIILDPFLGSGTTGVAAIRNGFQFIGIEKELEYFQIAEKRIWYENERSDSGIQD
jgi:site-specific DNA-methyltransferase (adenine-specific)